MPSTCGSCRYWRRQIQDVGLCQRYPPTLVASGAAMHPETNETHWCGEYGASFWPHLTHEDASEVMRGPRPAFDPGDNYYDG